MSQEKVNPMLRSLLFAAAAPPRHRPARPDEARFQAADPASGPPPPATTGYRPDPGGPRSPRFRIGRSAKWALVLAAAVFIFRRVIASVVLTALKETEQALALYSAALANRQSLVEAQGKIHEAFRIAHDQFLAGSLSNLDLLTTEQSLVALDAAVASSDASLVQDQIAVFKALGGGWRRENRGAR